MRRRYFVRYTSIDSGKWFDMSYHSARRAKDAARFMITEHAAARIDSEYLGIYLGDDRPGPFAPTSAYVPEFPIHFRHVRSS